MAKRPKTVLGVLKRARKLISKQWIKGSYVARVDNVGLCFCAVGAISFVANGTAFPALLETETKTKSLAAKSYEAMVDDPKVKACTFKFERVDPRSTCIAYNDSPRRTHAQVIAWFDRTIARLEKKMPDRMRQ